MRRREPKRPFLSQIDGPELVRATILNQGFFESGFLNPGKDRTGQFSFEKFVEIVRCDEMETGTTCRGDEAGAFPGERAGGEFRLDFESGFDGVNWSEREDGTIGIMITDLITDAGDPSRIPINKRSR